VELLIVNITPNSDEMEKLLTFQTDVTAYHLYYIQEGILKYFETGDHTLKFVPLQIEELDFIQANCGAVGVLTRKESIQFLQERQIPYLDLNESSSNQQLGFGISFKGEGILAANHFINEAGVRSLIFIGADYCPSHLRRLSEFEAQANKNNIPVHPCLFSHFSTGFADGEKIQSHNLNHKKRLLQLLLKLEKPIGIFCGNDRIALNNYYFAKSQQFHVPTEISLLGVGSLQRSIGGWPEQVSVIQMDHHKLGYTAAQLMETFMTSGRAPQSVQLKSDRIVHRQTTLRSRNDDHQVRSAMEYIRKFPGTTAPSVCQHLDIPRSTLEARFQRIFGNSIAKLIDQERFRQARDLLKNFKYNLEAIATLSGYADRRHLRRNFYKHIEMSPSCYRNQFIKQQHRSSK